MLHIRLECLRLHTPCFKEINHLLDHSIFIFYLIENSNVSFYVGCSWRHWLDMMSNRIEIRDRTTRVLTLTSKESKAIAATKSWLSTYTWSPCWCRLLRWENCYEPCYQAATASLSSLSPSNLFCINESWDKWNQSTKTTHFQKSWA